MGILSKMKERKTRSVESKKEAVDRKKKKTEAGEEIPEITDAGKWLREIRNMAEKGVDEIDEFYDKIVGKSKSVSDFVLNLGVISANYLSFRYEVYSKLADHYGDTKKAIKDVDKALKDVDIEFIDKLIEVVRKWMLR